jgi:hypothetical protein
MQPSEHSQSSSYLAAGQFLSSPRSSSYPLAETSEDAKYNYEAIEIILKSENVNLKQQNELLLREVYKLKAVNRKYKDQYRIKKL